MRKRQRIEDRGSRIEDRLMRNHAIFYLRPSILDHQGGDSFEIEQAPDGASEDRPRLFFARADPA
jgi:hypothetical protein